MKPHELLIRLGFIPGFVVLISTMLYQGLKP